MDGQLSLILPDAEIMLDGRRIRARRMPQVAWRWIAFRGLNQSSLIAIFTFQTGQTPWVDSVTVALLILLSQSSKGHMSGSQDIVARSAA